MRFYAEATVGFRLAVHCLRDNTACQIESSGNQGECVSGEFCSRWNLPRNSHESDVVTVISEVNIMEEASETSTVTSVSRPNSTFATPLSSRHLFPLSRSTIWENGRRFRVRPG